jgi:hypothetical protein
VPHSFDEAYAASGEMLPNRGNADGNPYSYTRLSDRIYAFRTRDDVELNYLNGNYVSSKELARWIEAQGTPEEKEMLERYRPLFR